MSNRPVLTELILEMTNACHHRCVHCSTVGGLPFENELNQDERLRVLREACLLGLVELRLLGGDPLFRLPDTLEILTEANTLGVRKALIYTSAVEQRIEWLGTLASFSPMRVCAEASIYSAAPSIHDGITVKPGSLERLLRNSREAVRVGFDLNWNFVWMKPNFSELHSVVALASEIGIKQVRILRLMLNGRARDNSLLLALPPELEVQCGAVIQEVGSRFPNVVLAFSKPLAFQLSASGEGKAASCSAGGGQLVVEANGSVLPCIGMKGMQQFKIGDVRRESVETIFARSRGMHFETMSLEIQECPAIVYQSQQELVRLRLDQGRN